MVLSVSAARATATADEIIVALGNADDCLGRLSQIKRGQQTLGDLVVAEPGLLNTWSQGRKETREAIEQRAFAKLVLALINAWSVIGPPTARRQAPSQSVEGGRAAGVDTTPGAGVLSVVANGPGSKRRKVTNVATFKGPLDKIAQNATQSVHRLWIWAPVCTTLVGLVFLVIMCRKPELAFFIPARVVGMSLNWTWTSFLALCETVEREVCSFFIPGSAPSVVETVLPHQMLGSHAPPSVTAALGWCVAVYLAMRRE
jgi:hypothetical protein